MDELGPRPPARGARRPFGSLGDPQRRWDDRAAPLPAGGGRVRSPPTWSGWHFRGRRPVTGGCCRRGARNPAPRALRSDSTGSRCDVKVSSPTTWICWSPPSPLTGGAKRLPAGRRVRTLGPSLWDGMAASGWRVATGRPRGLRASRRRLGRSPSPRAAAPTRVRSTPPHRTAAHVRMEQPHTDESKVVGPRRRGPYQPSDRRAAVHPAGTVATHVEHVLGKLGHANRVELAADATCPLYQILLEAQELGQHPKKAEPTHEQNLPLAVQADRPGRRVDASNQMVINTTRSWRHGARRTSVM